MMSERLDWTQKLGEAFLAQEQDIMDSVQRMRARAYDRKKLETTREQVVSVKQEQNRQVISIEPAVPDAISFPITNRRWSTATGHTLTIRHIPTTGVIPAISPPA
jgi:hypothetical protein